MWPLNPRIVSVPHIRSRIDTPPIDENLKVQMQTGTFSSGTVDADNIPGLYDVPDLNRCL